ncbi:MAG: adenosylcobinamide-GDP ribazoletransferase [Pseudomonadota bacterium]
MRRELILFASAIQFLTRLPIGTHCWDEDRLARASRYFALTGALVGAIGATVWWVAGQHLPPAVAAGLAIATGVLISGALHEDGLADTADALGGHVDREKALEIMRDSRIGTYGAVAVMLSLGLRWAALASFAAPTGVLAIIAAAAIGRALMVPATRIAGYARPSGLGALVEDGARWSEIAFALVTATALCLLLGATALWALVVAAAIAWLILRLQLRRLGGYTGDGLGAIAHVAETAALVTLAGIYA